MKIKFTVLIFLLAHLTVKAQNTTTLNVSVKNAKADSNLNVTVTITSVEDSTKTFSKVTEKNRASFTVPTFSKYLVELSSTEYKAKEYTANITDKPFNLNFTLTPNEKALGAVVVKAKKPLITQEDDKTIVDATNLANTSSNAYEVLEKTPGVIVDQDGNAYLSSTSPATVFINGREMKLNGEEIAALLKNLPANSVSKIEILRNPSAKYDASSNGGILNIVLKKGVKLGSSGSANISHFQGVYSSTSAGLSLNNNTGKLTSYGSLQFSRSNNFTEYQADRFISRDNSVLKQTAYTTVPNKSVYFGGGLDYAINKKFSVSYDLRLNYNKSQSFAENNIDNLFQGSGSLIAATRNTSDNNSNNVFWNNTIASKYKIDSLGSELVTEISYNNYRTNNTQNYFNNFNTTPARRIVGEGDLDNRRNIITIQSDFTYKLPKKYTLEVGFKGTFSTSKNRATYLVDSNATGKKVDAFQTNSFDFSESITALYLQLGKNFGGFIVKPGVRLETTSIIGDQLVPTRTNFAIKRTDLFPYLFVNKRLFKLMGMELKGNLIYRRSIRRPYYEVLNPSPRLVDQFLFTQGNPNLRPQFTTNYEFNIMVEDFPVIAAGINETRDIFNNVTYQDDVTKIATRTWDNLGKNKELYLRFVAGIPPGGKYFFYMAAQHNFNEYDGSYQNQPLQYKFGSWVFFGYHEWKTTPTLTMSLNGFWRTRGLQDFFEIRNFGGIYFSMNKSIMNKKANIIFAVNDVFRTNVVNFNLAQANIRVDGMRASDTRRFGLTFRYNFGLNKPKDNSEFGGNIENKVN